jgi:sugar lactone lactonase YvrE
MPVKEAELVLDAKAMLGEGPSWDAASGRLHWVDIVRGEVHSYDPATGTDGKYAIGQMVGAAVTDGNGKFILAAQHGFMEFDPETRSLTAIADPESHIPGNRFNDGKCDAEGRFWAGTMKMQAQDTTGALYCLHADLRVERKVANVQCSNGIAWSPDHTAMYYIDTPTRQVVRYDFDLETGRIAGGRPILEFPEGEGFPDGMTSDAEGNLWIAHWDGYGVSCWDPRTGKRLDKIGVPAARVTSCVFGGSRLDELYITTAREGLSDAELAGQPLAGGIFRYSPGVRGMPSYSFRRQQKG